MGEIHLINIKSILASEYRLLKAMKECKIEELEILLHDDLLFNIPNGQTITKTMDLETYRSGNMKINEILADEQNINLIGDNAIITCTIRMKGMYFNHTLDGKYRFIRVWKLVDNKWRVIAGSSILL